MFFNDKTLTTLYALDWDLNSFLYWGNIVFSSFLVVVTTFDVLVASTPIDNLTTPVTLILSFSDSVSEEIYLNYFIRQHFLYGNMPGNMRWAYFRCYTETIYRYLCLFDLHDYLLELAENEVKKVSKHTPNGYPQKVSFSTGDVGQFLEENFIQTDFQTMSQAPSTVPTDILMGDAIDLFGKTNRLQEKLEKKYYNELNLFLESQKLYFENFSRNLKINEELTQLDQIGTFFYEFSYSNETSICGYSEVEIIFIDEYTPAIE